MLAPGGAAVVGDHHGAGRRGRPTHFSPGDGDAAEDRQQPAAGRQHHRRLAGRTRRRLRRRRTASRHRAPGPAVVRWRCGGGPRRCPGCPRTARCTAATAGRPGPGTGSGSAPSGWGRRTAARLGDQLAAAGLQARRTRSRCPARPPGCRRTTRSPSLPSGSVSEVRGVALHGGRRQVGVLGCRRLRDLAVGRDGGSSGGADSVWGLCAESVSCGHVVDGTVQSCRGGSQVGLGGQLQVGQVGGDGGEGEALASRCAATAPAGGVDACGDTGRRGGLGDPVSSAASNSSSTAGSPGNAPPTAMARSDGPT